MLSVRQAGNPTFDFLKPGDRLHPYYRWLVRANPLESQPLADESAQIPAAMEAAQPSGAISHIFVVHQ